MKLKGICPIFLKKFQRLKTPAGKIRTADALRHTGGQQASFKRDRPFPERKYFPQKDNRPAFPEPEFLQGAENCHGSLYYAGKTEHKRRSCGDHC